ncbi:hypothetical protein [Halosegnis sp.]|uniref:hypothetical protein n=1 Tax=Halosegnis sp. TaxID=2864959 RepID=UPI0035D457F3
MSNAHTPTDDSSFNDALAALIEEAYHNGTDVEGAWKCTIDGNGDFHWDVQISRVAYED